MKRILLLLAIMTVMILPLAASGTDEKYPADTISIVVPSKAGGSTDSTARQFSQVAKKFWPEANFIIVNKGGSGGLMGFDEIARAEPDGYTLGMVFTPQLVAHVVSKRSHYTLDSFHVIGNIVEDAGVVAVPADSPINNLDDLKKLATERKVVAAVNGIGSDDYIAAKSFEKITGVEFNLMPTSGSTEQKTAILGGHVDVSFMNLSQILSNHRSGKAKIIAVCTKERSPIDNTIPTAKEQGYELYMTATRGMVVQADVAPEIQKALDQLVSKVVADPDFKAAMEKQLITLSPMSGKEYLAYLTDLQAQTQEVYDKSPW
jgi:tripartite-type tricarboxylate transporter receptor subunit TctC